MVLLDNDWKEVKDKARKYINYADEDGKKEKISIDRKVIDISNYSFLMYLYHVLMLVIKVGFYMLLNISLCLNCK